MRAGQRVCGGGAVEALLRLDAGGNEERGGKENIYWVLGGVSWEEALQIPFWLERNGGNGREK